MINITRKGYIELRRASDDALVSRHTAEAEVLEAVSKQPDGDYYANYPRYEYAKTTQACPVPAPTPDPTPDPDPAPLPEPAPLDVIAAAIEALPKHRDLMTAPAVPYRKVRPGLAGYSRYSLANCDDTLLMVHGENSTSCHVVDRAAGKTVKTHQVGEHHDTRWNYTDPRELIYHDRMRLYRMDALTGASTLMRDFAADFPDGSYITMDAEGDSSNDSRFWCFMVMREVQTGSYPCVAIFTYDAAENRILGTLRAADLGVPQLRRPNMVEVSPDGKWAFIHTGRSYSGWYESLTGTVQDGPHFWPLDLDPAGAVRACPDETHSGWALDAEGRPMFVYQNNRTDWIEAIYPGVEYRADGANQMRIAHQGEFDSDWRMGWHIAKAYGVRGYALISTYSSRNHDWADNQLYLYPLQPDAVPRRIGPTMTAYPGSDGYRNESPASWSFSGRLVHWHSNGGVGSGVREVYEVNLLGEG